MVSHVMHLSTLYGYPRLCMEVVILNFVISWHDTNHMSKTSSTVTISIKEFWIHKVSGCVDSGWKRARNRGDIIET